MVLRFVVDVFFVGDMSSGYKRQLSLFNVLLSPLLNAQVAVADDSTFNRPNRGDGRTFYKRNTR